MSSFDIAFAWTMNFEDPKHEYATVPDEPPGAFAIAGVNSAAWPKDFATINALGQDYRPAAVAQFYREEFWNQWLEQIESDEVAKRVFDAGVNMGSGTATTILQKAILQCDPDAAFDIDGVFGPHTLMRVNIEPPEKLATAFCAQRVQHYQAIVAANPALQEYLAGWLARATA
jgi:lysozyme family protein